MCGLKRGSREERESKTMKEKIKMVRGEGMGVKRRRESLVRCLRVISKDPGLPSLTYGPANRMWYICCYGWYNTRVTRLWGSKQTTGLSISHDKLDM